MAKSNQRNGARDWVPPILLLALLLTFTTGCKGNNNNTPPNTAGPGTGTTQPSNPADYGDGFDEGFRGGWTDGWKKGIKAAIEKLGATGECAYDPETTKPGPPPDPGSEKVVYERTDIDTTGVTNTTSTSSTTSTSASVSTSSTPGNSVPPTTTVTSPGTAVSDRERGKKDGYEAGFKSGYRAGFAKVKRCLEGRDRKPEDTVGDDDDEDEKPLPGEDTGIDPRKVTTVRVRIGSKVRVTLKIGGGLTSVKIRGKGVLVRIKDAERDGQGRITWVRIEIDGTVVRLRVGGGSLKVKIHGEQEDVRISVGTSTEPGTKDDDQTDDGAASDDSDDDDDAGDDLVEDDPDDDSTGSTASTTPSTK